MIIRKILLLGEMAVGKTSIIQRLRFDTFDANYKSTIGMDIYHYDVDLGPDMQFKFLVCDTDGKFDDALFRDKHVKGAEAAIVVGDLSRRATLEAQVTLAYRFCDAIPGRYVGCVLNKKDLIEEGQCDPDYIPEPLRGTSFPILETSAKTGLNVKRTFEEAAATIVRRGW